MTAFWKRLALFCGIVCFSFTVLTPTYATSVITTVASDDTLP